MNEKGYERPGYIGGFDIGATKNYPRIDWRGDSEGGSGNKEDMRFS